MRFASLSILLLVAQIALGQDAASTPPVRIESVRASVRAGEVRIDIKTSAPVEAPGAVMPYPDMLILDLPGVAQEGMGRRIQINKADVRDVRVWMQEQKPPMVRISVGMNRDKAYTLSVEGNRLTLRIGPGLQNAGRARSRPSQQLSTVIPAGRASRSVAGTVGAIFTRDRKQPATTVTRPQPATLSTGNSGSMAPIQINEATLNELNTASSRAPRTAPPVGAPADSGDTPSPGAESATKALPTSLSEAAGQLGGSVASVAPANANTPASGISTRPAPAVVAASGPIAMPVPAALPAPEPGISTSAPGSAAAVVTPAPMLTSAAPVTPPGPAPVTHPAVEPMASVPEPSPASLVPSPTAVISAPSSLASAAPESALGISAPDPSGTDLIASATAPATPESSATGPSPEPAVAPVPPPPPVPNANIRTLFHIKFVQQDTAYIDGGRAAGLAEGMKLIVSGPGPDGQLPKGISADTAVAELTVVAIAETSAATQIRVPKRDVVPGDLAYFSDADLQTLVEQHSLSSTRRYPVVISFTEEADALDAEARVEDVPRPPLPSVNRMQGRFGIDYIATQNLGSTQSSGKDVGFVVRADFTRMGGTYWNFRGYWRGRLDYLSSGTQPTLQELINRTYHLALTYDNPTGHWVAGFGRLLLPWASSLETLDGGYFGRRLRSNVIAGVFAGTTPDPSSWNYDPDRQMGGGFVNITGGSFEALRYSGTTGVGASFLNWKMDRPMVFFENNFSFRRDFSIYHSLQADSPAGNVATTAPGPGIGRSFLTIRWSPVSRLELDFNHTYFRNVPTFDPTLVGTGLLDKYLFQGFSGGGRIALVKQISVYTELGRSNRTGDSTAALNSLYGVTFGRVPWLNARADVHYSRFNSSFGSGSYRALNFTRNFRESLRLEVMGGTQAFTSSLAGNQTAKFLTTTVDSNLGSTLFVQGGFTVYRGQQQSYNQFNFMLGYRFDSKWRR